MNAIIGFIEKGKPFFNKLAGNAYLQAIRDGFLAAMPAILFSSIFILCAALPEVFGVTLPAELSSWLWRVYNLSMGIVTPPFGGCMFVATGLDKRITLEGLYKGVLPYCLAGMVGILLITFVEPLSMFLVNIMR